MAVSGQRVIESTIDSLYLAVSDEERWPEALQGIARAFDSPRVAVLRTPPNVDGLYEMRAFNHDAEAQRLYREYYWALDPTHRVTRESPVGDWLDCAHLLDPKTTPEPEYTDFAIRHGIRFVAGGRVHLDPESCVLLGLQRPADHKPFPAEAARVFNRLGVHIGRAAKLCADLRQAELAKGLSLAALDAIDWPVYAVAATGRLLLANRAGERQLEAAAPFCVRHQLLHCGDADAAAALHKAIAAAGHRRGSAFRVPGAGAGWLVRVVPVSGYAGAALVYVSPAEPPPTQEDLLRQLWNFSKAEAEIAFMLADGLSVKEIAFARGVSVHTVRAQIREIYRKTGVRRQADFAKVLYGLPQVTFG